jgi:hypothetical protein
MTLSRAALQRLTALLILLSLVFSLAPVEAAWAGDGAFEGPAPRFGAAAHTGARPFAARKITAAGPAAMAEPAAMAAAVEPQPALQPAAYVAPAAQPAVEPAAQPAVEPASPVVEPAAQPVVEPAAAPSDLERFVASVVDGSGALRGVYVPGVLALRVRQQPAGSPYYVDLSAGVATQFGAASAFGVTGLLADNVSSGVQFYGLSGGQEVTLVYGDGSLRRYQVGAVYRFQALSPRSPYSDFVNLDTGATLTSSDLFSQMYGGGDRVVFQTCIAGDGLASWGRLFVIATPIG